LRTIYALSDNFSKDNKYRMLKKLYNWWILKIPLYNISKLVMKISPKLKMNNEKRISKVLIDWWLDFQSKHSWRKNNMNVNTVVGKENKKCWTVYSQSLIRLSIIWWPKCENLKSWHRVPMKNIWKCKKISTKAYISSEWFSIVPVF